MGSCALLLPLTGERCGCVLFLAVDGGGGGNCGGSKGGADGGPARHFRSGSKGFEYCHEASWAPLERLEPARGGRALTFNASRLGGSVRPWMVHSNGYHFVLKSPVLAPIMRRYEGYPPRLLAHPVLLVDGGHVTCEVTTLGNLMNMTGGSASDD